MLIYPVNINTTNKDNTNGRTAMMNILLVEDEEMVADSLMATLKTWDQKVVWATTKREALLKAGQSFFDLFSWISCSRMVLVTR